MIAVPGGPFEDREADNILFQTLGNGLADSGIEVVVDGRAINEEGFAHDIAEALIKKMGVSSRVA
jgi:uncharacterized protein (UPF0261 family)